jgi:hypothetical protein
VTGEVSLSLVRVEIVQELDAGDDTLEIPWASPVQPELRYLDLKAHPEEIDRLEECRKYPPLADFLRRVNSATSPFRSAKCDVWTTTGLAEDEQVDFKLPVKVGGYVDLLFDRPDLNSKLEPHLQLGAKLSEILGRLRVQAQMEICVRRCLFHPEGRWGYYVTVFTHAYGATPREAEEEWNRAMDALGNELAGIDYSLYGLPADLSKKGSFP